MTIKPSTTVRYDPFAQQVFDDPYPIYELLRREQPLYHSGELDFWALSRAADIQPVLQDHARFSNSNGVDLDGADQLIGDGNFLDEDPPRHDVLRKIVHGSFNARTVASLADYVEQRVGELLDACAQLGRFDFVENLSSPLPLAVICHILGVPLADHGRVAELVHHFTSRDVGSATVPERAIAARDELAEYFAALAHSRRQQHRSDVLSHVAHSEVEGGRLSDATIVGIVLILFTAGSETVSNMLSNSIVNLHRAPEQRQLLYRGDVPVERAVEELIRFDAPVQSTMRTVLEDTEVLGETIPAGARLLLVTGSANRDEQRYDRPDVLDFTREPRRHMGFGYGIHFCIGAPLARLQARIALDQLVRRGLTCVPVGDGVRRTKVDSRGFAALPVTLAA
jgi:cytochrome P450